MISKDKIFREYDIRGVVDEDFDAGLAHMLGRAFAALAIEDIEQSSERNLRIAVGADCRLTGPKLKNSLIKGLTEGGVDVVDCGMGPTPQLYFAVFDQETDGGIQVTGSHNPPDQNGFKMMIGRSTLSGDYIQRLKNKVTEIAAMTDYQPATANAVTEVDIQSRYIDELVALAKPHMGSKKLKVVIDGGNGVGGMVAPEVLRQLGCEVVEMYCEPDGRFPNHHPDPTVMVNIAEMRKRVVEEGADMGIAYDGDADRIGVVDEKGEVIFGDMLLVIYGKQLLKEVDNPTIIADVKCSQLFFDELAKLGANTVMAKTGHSLIKAKLKETNAHLAGEMSGHIFFAHRYLGFDDAMHASARLVEIASSSDITVSEMLADIPKTVSTPELRIDCPDEIKFDVVQRAQTAFPDYDVNTLDGARISFENGWGLVRASNTQAALVMRFEAETESQLNEYRQIVEKRIAEIKEAL